MAPYAYVFWAWVLVSLVLFAKRRIDGARRRRTARRSTPVAQPREAGPPVPAEALVPAGATAHPPASQPRPGPVTASAAAPPPQTAPSPGRLPTIAEIRAMQQRTVLDVLAGVRMPCELLPLGAATGELAGARRIVLATTLHRPAEVRDALGAELARVGFRVAELSPSTLAASGPRGDVTATIHKPPAPFPTAPENGVVVELALA